MAEVKDILKTFGVTMLRQMNLIRALQEVAYKDETDRTIGGHHTGSYDLLPRDTASWLKGYKFKPWSEFSAYTA